LLDDVMDKHPSIAPTKRKESIAVEDRPPRRQQAVDLVEELFGHADVIEAGRPVAPPTPAQLLAGGIAVDLRGLLGGCLFGARLVVARGSHIPATAHRAVVHPCRVCQDPAIPSRESVEFGQPLRR